MWSPILHLSHLGLWLGSEREQGKEGRAAGGREGKREHLGAEGHKASGDMGAELTHHHVCHVLLVQARYLVSLDSGGGRGVQTDSPSWWEQLQTPSQRIWKEGDH